MSPLAPLTPLYIPQFLRSRVPCPATRVKMVQEIVEATEFESATKEAAIVVVDFYAVWCGPCRFISPIIEDMESELKTSHPGKTLFYKVDVDKNVELSEKMGITAMPSFQVYFNGELHHTVIGANHEQLRKTVNELLEKL